MTARKWSVAAAAIVLSSALHAAAVGRLAPSPTPEPDLSAGGAQAIPLLGDSFADMAAGGAAPSAPPAMAPKVAAAPTIPVAVTVAALPPVIPTAAPSPQLDLAQPPKPEAATKPVPEELSKPVAEATVAAVPEATLVRPQERPKKAKPTATPLPKAIGNSDSNGKKGMAKGTAAGRASGAKATGTVDKGDGGKAAASYGSTVLRKISRTRKAKAPAKGRVVVGFVIAANGGLQSARVVTSSGDAGLDKVALDHIRRAAPFPAPPPSAQRQFAFEFLGKH